VLKAEVLRNHLCIWGDRESVCVRENPRGGERHGEKEKEREGERAREKERERGKE